MRVSTWSTAEILALKVLGLGIDQRFVDWAVAQLEEGHDSPHLRVLAGESAPFNNFEMKNLVDTVQRELGLTAPPDEESALRSYATERVRASVSGFASAQMVLDELAKLCMKFGYSGVLYDFYLLHWAYSDLRDYGNQYYWPDADRANIDAVISSYFETWLEENGADT